ncbi:DNA primase [Kordiimonas sp. SCSIO 12610]|uniref:DNA primase n=1 Tax=Kordiimonas sp. SCSIO 12610 TaxID=2829597 RepID=UPI0021096770|nr:DNA primase [Kordiimonas sp. SCSIO 12610]UTW54946.1 DNA primase [Kordiimonas sp. SCSIO 12610]
MALSPQFLDELKHRFTLSDVVGRKVKLIRRGREHTGLCPFHNEKTPSFTVNDQKGFYHCFGCGQHGSVIDFVMNTEGLTFPETIEQLAGQVGMDVPKPSREAVEREKARASLSEVMEAVTSWYEAQLYGQVGKGAFEYIKGRGLNDKTLKDFRLGFAPNSRSALKDAMQGRGIYEDQLIETGMLIKPEDGRDSYDRFRDRLMFPISDRQGRIIAFGGRALSKDAKAKYLNSPETVLFHKGATLYNWANARAASYDVGQVMVVEGYMDVIALAQAGINYAVAPLGTALTEEQIAHLWQMGDEPILSFDGDNAGRRAAMRAMDRALPMLRPGKSLRFVFMPDGDDPDTLVQREGKGAIERKIDEAEPLVNMLWRELNEGIVTDTPERRAGFEKKVFGRLSEIQDENVKKLYQSEFRNRIWQQFKSKRQSNNAAYQRRTGAYGKPMPFSHSTGLLGKTALGKGTGTGPVTDRLQQLLVLAVLNHPEILVSYEEAFATLDLSLADLGKIQSAILEFMTENDTLEETKLTHYLVDRGIGGAKDRLLANKSLKDDWFAWPDAALGDAITGFEHTLKRFHHITDCWAAYRQAETEYASDMTEENHARFVAAQQAYRELEEKEADKDGYRLESGRLSYN